MPILVVGDRDIELDNDGHLVEFRQWSEEVAQALAEREGLPGLGEEHLGVIRVIHDYYEEHEVAPMLTRVSRDSGRSYRELHSLFRKQPGKRAAKLAGLPKASGCS